MVGRGSAACIISTLVLLVGGLVGTASPAHAGSAGIDWSGVPTAFNPDATTVTVTTAFAGEEDLFYEWGGVWRPLNSSGTTTLQFDTGGTGTVEVIACPPDVAPSTTACTSTGDDSPVLHLRREILMGRVNGGPVPRGSTISGKVFMRPKVVDPAIPATWHLKRNYNGPDVYSGSTTIDSTSESTSPTYAIELPRTISGGFIFQLTIDDYDIPPFGPLSGASDEESISVLDWRPWVSADAWSFFPVPDGYHDRAAVTVRAHEPVGGDLEVRDESGEVVRVLRRGGVPAGETTVSWDGLRTDGTLAPEGTYRVGLTATDQHGNEAYRSTGINVSHRRRVTRTFTRTLPAATGLVSTRVGRCARLAAPSRRGWSGSLGYYSSAKCRNRTPLASRIVTTGALEVPQAFEGRYGQATLSLYGGAATGAPTSRIRARLIPADGSDSAWTKWGPALSDHATPWSPGRDVVRTVSGSQQVRWAIMTGGRSRYDVKDVTVTLTYTVLN